MNFNRAFAGFGLDDGIKRLSVLLEELTLQGGGAENSKGLFSSMSYFTAVNSPENEAFRAEYAANAGADGPPLSMLGADCYSGFHCAAALPEAAGGNDAAAVMPTSEGLSYKTATGLATMTNRHVNKDIYLAECQGADFDIVKTFDAVAHGESCSV